MINLILTNKFSAALVPCVDTCTLCDILLLGQSIINFLIQLATALAIIGVLYGGFYLLTSGGSPTRIQQGKDALWTTLKGIVIAYAAWLFINTLLLVFVSGDTSGTGIATILSKPWNQITCY